MKLTGTIWVAKDGTLLFQGNNGARLYFGGVSLDVAVKLSLLREDGVNLGPQEVEIELAVTAKAPETIPSPASAIVSRARKP